MREQSNNQTILDQAKLGQIPNYDHTNMATIFSPIIPLMILLISYPYWKSLEEGIGIANRSDSFFLSNFIFIFTVLISSLLFKFGPKLININDPALIEKWEKNNSQYQRVYWMDPLDMHQHLSLGGKTIRTILISLSTGLATISTSISIVILFVFLVFDSAIILTVVLVVPVFISIWWVQIYLIYDTTYSATAIYLHEDKVIIRSALMFRSLPSSSYKFEKIKNIYVKEFHSHMWDSPLFQLKFKKNRFIENTIAYSDDSERMEELKSKIENYSKTVLLTES